MKILEVTELKKEGEYNGVINKNVDPKSSEKQKDLNLIFWSKNMESTNEKKIVKRIIADKYPHFVPIENEFIEIVREIFQVIGKEVLEGNKVLVKNFGTFELKQRTPRRRYDTGMKAVVTTEPASIVEFTQSPNIFRNGMD